MAEVVHDAQQEFWRPPSVLDTVAETKLPLLSSHDLADTCQGCGSEFMIGARFCHTCGSSRPVLAKMDMTLDTAVADISGVWARSVATAVALTGSVAQAWREIEFPGWLYYLHFHEIKRRVGLPTAALVAFIIGLGCVAGALGSASSITPRIWRSFRRFRCGALNGCWPRRPRLWQEFCLRNLRTIATKFPSRRLVLNLGLALDLKSLSFASRPGCATLLVHAVEMVDGSGAASERMTGGDRRGDVGLGQESGFG